MNKFVKLIFTSYIFISIILFAHYVSSKNSSTGKAFFHIKNNRNCCFAPMSMPRIGLGTYLLGNNNSPESIKKAISSAIKVGYRRIDCAPVYFNEHIIGDALQYEFTKIKREDIYITSKLASPFHRYEHVESALKKTLSDLRLDYLDLYLMHWPIAFQYVPNMLNTDIRGYPNEDIDESDSGKLIDPSVSIHDTWKAMEALVDKGLVREIGVSNFPTSLLHELLSKSRIKPSVNQIELHPYLQQNNLIKYCMFRGVKVQAYSVLGTPGYKEDDEPNILHDKVLQDIANKNNVSVSQVCLLWALQRNTSVCVKSSSEGHQRKNLDALSSDKDNDDSSLKLILRDIDMERISELDRGYRYFRPEDWWGDYHMAVFE